MISFEDSDVETTGHKFGIPQLPIPSNANIKHRYDPLIHQVTNLLMVDGKLSKAQRVRSQFISPQCSVIICSFFLLLHI